MSSSSHANASGSTSFACYRKGDPARYFKYEDLKEGFFREAKKDAKSSAFKAHNDKLRYAAENADMRHKSGELGSFEVSDTASLMQTFTVEYAQAPLIGLELMPVVDSPEEGGSYLERVRLEEWNASRRGGSRGTRATTRIVDNYVYDKLSYQCESFSKSGYLGKDVVLSDSAPINGMFNLRESVDRQIAEDRERAIRDIMTDATNYNTANKRTLTAGLRWDENGGDPGNDITNAMGNIWVGDGSTRLVAWTSWDVWNALRKSESMLHLLPTTAQGYLTPEQFLDITGLDGLLVSEARENTANPGQAATWTRMWGNYFGICRVAVMPALKSASFGWTFRWTPSSMPTGFNTNLWYDPEEGDFGSFGYKVALKETHKVVAKDTGFLFTTPIN